MCPLVYSKIFTDEYYPSGYFRRRTLCADSVSPRMNTIASRDQSKPIRIGENLVVNYKSNPSSSLFCAVCCAMPHLNFTSLSSAIAIQCHKHCFKGWCRCYLHVSVGRNLVEKSVSLGLFENHLYCGIVTMLVICISNVTTQHFNYSTLLPFHSQLPGHQEVSVRILSILQPLKWTGQLQKTPMDPSKVTRWEINAFCPLLALYLVFFCTAS